MRWMTSVAVVLLAASMPALRAGGQTASTAPAELKLARELLEDFEKRLKDPAAYDKTVRETCRGFPGRRIAPYALPAMAYANLGVANPQFRKTALERIEALIKLARPRVASVVKPPGGELEKLRSYRAHATHLGQYNLMLGACRLLGGGKAVEPEYKAISDMLRAGLVERKGAPLNSAPHLRRTFDTIPVLVSLAVRDQVSGKPLSAPAIKAHLAWVDAKGLEPNTKLPYARVTPSGRGLLSPRGSDLSWRIALLSNIEPARARTYYKRYVEHFWMDEAALRGLAEWPSGTGGYQGVDTGPIVDGVGATASALGIAAARTVDDKRRLPLLINHAENLKLLLKRLAASKPAALEQMTLGGRIDPDSEYVSGYLYGDCVLFYATTYRPWLKADGT